MELYPPSADKQPISSSHTNQHSEWESAAINYQPAVLSTLHHTNPLRFSAISAYPAMTAAPRPPEQQCNVQSTYPQFVFKFPDNCHGMDTQYSENEPPVYIHSPTPVSAYSSGVFPPETPVGVGVRVAPAEQYMPTTQVMFPTPCDLLHDLAMRDRTASHNCSLTPQTDISYKAEPAEQHRRSKQPSRGGRRSKQVSPQGAAKPENQRKAYFRSVAETVGFLATDPDTITSHDKKRLYLECLEKYVLWIHEHLRLAGKEPIPLERAIAYPGLESRSIRAILVHMQSESRGLHDLILEEEERFLRLREEVLAQDVPVCVEGLDVRRHSIAAPSGTSAERRN